MKDRWKQWKQWWSEHDEEAFYVGTLGIAVTIGTLVGYKIAKSHDVLWIDQYYDKEEGNTVYMDAHLRNGRTRAFIRKLDNVSKGGA